MMILGFTEDVTVCGMCGKLDLKGTFAVSVDSGLIYLGSSCIKKFYQLSDKEFTAKCKEGQKSQLILAKTAWRNSEEYLLKMGDDWDENFRVGEIQDLKKKEIADKYLVSWIHI